MKHRWPKSIHSQVEAIFHSVRSFRETKLDTPLGIRGFGSWKVYKYEAHRFAKFMSIRGHANLLDTQMVLVDMSDYLEERLDNHVKKNHSRQTLETTLSALGKFQYSVNNYIEQHVSEITRLDVELLREEFYAKGRKLLRKSSKLFSNRAYPDPVRLIENIVNGTHQLQASLQYEGGLRAEGAGAPSNRCVKNPLTKDCLLGIAADPATGSSKGVVASQEKGGKVTEHYVSVETYLRVEEYIGMNGLLESEYSQYLKSITIAARATGQYARGRGSHGLKFNFAQERYLECVQCGLTHEQALQNTSLETSHFRLRETLTYTRG